MILCDYRSWSISLLCHQVQISQLADYEQEPKAAGASCMNPSKEEERLIEENRRLTQKVNKLKRDKAKLNVGINSLSKTVERSEEEKGELNCQIDDLKAKLQDSARYGVPLFFY